MLKRTFLVAALLALVLAPITARAAAKDAASIPTVVIRLRSIDRVIADLKYLTELAGRGQEGKKIDEAIKKNFPDGIKGIDSKRPLGFYVVPDPDANVMETKAVLLVPVKDDKSFLDLLDKLNVKPAKDDDGIYSFTPENPAVTIYFRFAHGYAYATAMNKAALDKDKLLTPGKLFLENYPEFVSASFRLDQIPEVLRNIIISQVELRLAAVSDEKPAGETKAQQQLKAEVVKGISRHLTTLLKDGAEIALRLDVDRKAGKLYTEFSVAGKPGSNLESELAALGKSESLFAGILESGSAINLVIHGALPEHLRKALEPVVDEAIKKGLEKEQDPAKRAHAHKLAGALTPSLKSGELDAAVSLRGPGAGKHYTLVAGLKLKDGAALDSVVRDLVKELPEEAKSFIKVDAESAGDVKIHRLDAQHHFDEEARTVFGDNPFYVAMRSDALFIAGGEGGLRALKEALSAKPGVAPPLSLQLSLSHLTPLMGKKHKIDPVAAAEMDLAGAKDSDKVHISIAGGKTLKIRLSMDAAVLKFFSKIDNKKSAD